MNRRQLFGAALLAPLVKLGLVKPAEAARDHDITDWLPAEFPYEHVEVQVGQSYAPSIAGSGWYETQRFDAQMGDFSKAEYTLGSNGFWYSPGWPKDLVP